MSRPGVYIGVDLGGTNVRAGVVTEGGELLHWKEVPIQAARGPEAGVKKITTLVEDVTAGLDQRILALGIGSTGPLDREHGFIQNPYTLPGWENVDIVSPLQERFQVPAALENDADAAALGEAWVGAGSGVSSMVMITIGTGVGYSLITNGTIHRGVGGEHPEGGHIPIAPDGPECYCGARGCLESLAAGPAIASFARKIAGETPDSFLGNLAAGLPDGLDDIEARHVFEGARTGDPACLKLVDQTAFHIARGLITILMMILPDVIVFTGGVVQSFDLLEPRIRQELDAVNVIIPAADVKLVKSSLDQAGLLGAARAAQLLERNS